MPPSDLIDRREVVAMLEGIADKGETMRRRDEDDLAYRRRTAIANAARTLINSVNGLPQIHAAALLMTLREPTKEMLDASWRCTEGATNDQRMAALLAHPRRAHDVKMASRWRAMIDAAPRHLSICDAAASPSAIDSARERADRLEKHNIELEQTADDLHQDLLRTQAAIDSARAENADIIKALRQHLALFCGPDDAIAQQLFQIADAAIIRARGTPAPAETDKWWLNDSVRLTWLAQTGACIAHSSDGDCCWVHFPAERGEEARNQPGAFNTWREAIDAAMTASPSNPSEGA